MALTSSSVHFLRVSNCSRPCSFCPRRDVSKSRTNIRACNDTGGSLMSLLCNPEANLHCCNEGNTIFTSLLPCANCRAHLSSRQTMRPQHSRARHSTTQHSVTHMTGLLFQKLQSPTRQQLRRLAQTADPDGAGGCQGVEGSRHAVNQLFSFCRCLRLVYDLCSSTAQPCLHKPAWAATASSCKSKDLIFSTYSHDQMCCWNMTSGWKIVLMP